MNTRKDKHAVALGRKGGTRRSPEKTAAARINARYGGRPPSLPKAERLKRINARVASGKPLSPSEAALLFSTERGLRKALAMAYIKWTEETAKQGTEHETARDWWDAVIHHLERERDAR